jgi:hypothetical protein
MREDIEAPDLPIVLQPVERGSHVLPCPNCRDDFDLFAAPWCGHMKRHPSKLCPNCSDCLCHHPCYHEPGFWKDAPAAFRANGFERLFLLYL